MKDEGCVCLTIEYAILSLQLAYKIQSIDMLELHGL